MIQKLTIKLVKIVSELKVKISEVIIMNLNDLGLSISSVIIMNLFITY